MTPDRVYRHFVLHERFYLVGAWFTTCPSDPDQEDLIEFLLEAYPDVLAPTWVYKVLIMEEEGILGMVTSVEVPVPEDTEVEKSLWVMAGALCRRRLAEV